uniref:Uncharacterized protein n=1 Tax=Dulem virus 36 TaxID=3145754 RepID=A0AAU8AZ68_9CAUD
MDKELFSNILNQLGSMPDDEVVDTHENHGGFITLNGNCLVVPPHLRFLGISGESNVTTRRFKFPRYVGENKSIDLMQYNLYINYENIKGKSDAYWCEDRTEDVNGQYIYFDWIIYETALQEKGSLTVSVVAQNELGNVFVTKAYEFFVLKGIYTTSTISRKYPDIINQLVDRVLETKETFGTQIQESVNSYLEENPINVETDKTLTMSDVPADAAATKQYVDSADNKQKEDINELKEAVSGIDTLLQLI